MKNEAVRELSQALIDALLGLEAIHTDLIEMIDAKIEHMRQANVVGMNACVARERDLVRSIGEQEGRRRVTVERLGRAFGMASSQAKRLTASQLAQRMPEDRGCLLMAVADRLKQLTDKATRRNHVAGTLGRGVLKHMDGILSAMTAPQQSGGAYSAGGRSVAQSPQRLFETVG